MKEQSDESSLIERLEALVKASAEEDAEYARAADRFELKARQCKGNPALIGIGPLDGCMAIYRGTEWGIDPARPGAESTTRILAITEPSVFRRVKEHLGNLEDYPGIDSIVLLDREANRVDKTREILGETLMAFDVSQYEADRSDMYRRVEDKSNQPPNGYDHTRFSRSKKCRQKRK